MNSPSLTEPLPQRVAMFSVHSCPLAALGGRDTGGMNVYVRELGRHLAALGVAVDIYTRRQNPCMPVVTAYAPGARVIHLNAGPAMPYHKHRVWHHLPEFLARVQAFVAAEGLRYDVLHGHYWLSGWVGLQLSRRWRLPLVYMAHTLGHAKNAAARQPWEQEPLRRLLVERELVRQSHAVIAESPASLDHLKRHYGAEAGKVRLIPGGVDTALFCPGNRQQARRALGLPATAPLLLFVGRLQPLKGIDVLLRAAHLVCQQQPAAQVLVVGGGLDANDPHEVAERQRLQRLAQELRLTVHFVPAQPQATLVHYYTAADVFVMPSYYESFGMVVLEAMACGTPVVASDVGGLRSTVVHGETGLRVPAGDPAAFAQAILALLAAPARRQAMGQAARRRALSYAWSHIAAQTLTLYRHLMATLSAAHRATLPVTDRAS
ncbi:MAG: glycosyl transferase family 1 [Candidatus Tectimicrobiota bacterium]|nr:MAG: glycosyl transferase family 1 [Candidatus Tectomicrobia bacterium]